MGNTLAAIFAIPIYTFGHLKQPDLPPLNTTVSFNITTFSHSHHYIRRGMMHPPLNRRVLNSTDIPHNGTLNVANVTGIKQPKEELFHIYTGGGQIGMMILAGLMLVLFGLLTGLTLGVCGLDRTWLRLRAATGTPKEKRQAHRVMKLKKHSTWLLCSLVLCSVALGESFPFVVQVATGRDSYWLPVAISTVSIFFVGELFPQYLIPQHAVVWGYYLSPLVWFCMWITGLITWPLACALDYVFGLRDEHGIFTNNELGLLIKYHERSEKRGGMLSQDASRIMLGALKLDSRKLGGEISSFPDHSVDYSEDVEKADLFIVQGMIVKWHAVKTIDINEKVNPAFIKKVKGWSYSRIPVVGRSTIDRIDPSLGGPNNWEGTQVFGFLHIKNLIGLNVDSNEGLLVKDLPLYPLPIVREDMTVYELLNMFQLGMSRMAVVVPTVSDDEVVSGEIHRNDTARVMLWTATTRKNDRLITNANGGRYKPGWSAGYIEAAKHGADDNGKHRQSVKGIGCPKPIGIVTFEDLIDAILQKTSRDEKDFFDREVSIPPTKVKKAGDLPSFTETTFIETRTGSPFHVTWPRAKVQGTLRRRKISGDNRPGGLDGANDRSDQSSLKVKKIRTDNGNSSYTQNSQGGFHKDADDNYTLENAMIMTAEEIADLVNTSSSECFGNPYSATKAWQSSLPSRKSNEGFYDSLKNTRHVSAAPNLETSSHAKLSVGDHNDGSHENEKPVSGREFTTTGGNYLPIFHRDQSGIDIDETIHSHLFDRTTLHTHEESGETVTLSSFGGAQYQEMNEGEDISCLYDAFPVPVGNKGQAEMSVSELRGNVGENKTYTGFPPELLENGSKENRVPDFASMTLPRMLGPGDFDIFEERLSTRETPIREGSFHDDRALLPSQRRALEMGTNAGGGRSSSLWF